MRILIAISMLLILGCSEDVVNLPDLSPRVKLLEANDSLQDVRLGLLESRVTSLESRMDSVEDSIDAHEEKLAELCETVDYLDEELSSLSDRLSEAVRELRRADRRTRRMLRSSVADLRRQLMSEIRSRRLADSRLQRQLDSVERDLARFEARQRIINRFLTYGLYQANHRIDQLSRRINIALSRIDRRLGVLESEIDDINRSIRRLSSAIRRIYSRLSSIENDLEDQEVTVEEGCEGDLLLSIGGVLYAIGYETSTEEITVEAGGDMPTYFVCDRFVGRGNICLFGHNVDGGVVEVETTVEYQVIEDIYLVEAELSCEED